MEEDLTLINYISIHGEGVWNSLAQSAGLKRTGKSCRLRWLNYLRPDIRRGNITPEEKLLIMDLQARWGNRWSKIARQMPGRTDNEIKNYWRTRIQKKEAAVTVLKQSEEATTREEDDYDDDNNKYDQKSSMMQMNMDQNSPPPMYISPVHDDFLPDPSSAQSSDCLWGVDDLWSMH